MHLGDTNIEEGRGAGFGLYTWTVIKVQQVLKPLSCHIWMWGPCPPSCIYFCAVALCWLGTLMVLLIECSLENPLGDTQPVFHFLSLSTPSLPFYHLSLSLSLSVTLVCSTEVRSEERGMLERAGVIQSLTVGVGPIVLVIASVCTFTLHMALGYDLTAAQVFQRTTRNLNLKLIMKQFKCNTDASISWWLKSLSVSKSGVANNCLALNTSHLRLSP